MGKKRHIRSGAGDLVPLPGALHKQVEGVKITKKAKHSMVGEANESDIEPDVEHEFIDAGLSSKILEVARIQVESDGEDDDGDSIDNIDKQEVDTERSTGFTKTVRFKQKPDRMPPSQTEDQTLNTDGLSAEVVELYKEVGVVLSKYRSGKIPKAFKVIPSLVNWEHMLEWNLRLTCPENWTPAAMYQATRIFSSCMSPTMCQKFYNLILLPRIRDDIHEFKKLNPLLYESLFKAIFKPAAFIKGILLPLCASGDCTLKEANIIGNVLRKISIPALHASAAMLKIAEMEYSPDRAIFLRFLIDKNYTLPFRVVDGIVAHFLRMDVKRRESPLPVLWHRCLLAFVDRYKSDMSSEQREALLELIKVHLHPSITPEIRHQLETAKSREDENEDNAPERDREDDMEF